ncbi:MAG: ribosome maturation factor RimP [Candidatus Omnitrophica bacterium]|nr:ribosome maturation factor RimP [Candidatus Omnitrophota bacterium]
MEIANRIKEILEPIANERKYCVVDIMYKREGGKLVLRILLDKEGGIAMDECAGLNSELSELLDKENAIEDQYTLEISSPGLDRKLEKDKDFVWAVGKKVKVTTYAPLDGKNTFRGTLIGLGEDTAVIDENGISTEIPREKIASARLESDIDWSKK